MVLDVEVSPTCAPRNLRVDKWYLSLVKEWKDKTWIILWGWHERRGVPSFRRDSHRGAQWLILLKIINWILWCTRVSTPSAPFSLRLSIAAWHLIDSCNSISNVNIYINKNEDENMTYVSITKYINRTLHSVSCTHYISNEQSLHIYITLY